jgi:hypothetical protein
LISEENGTSSAVLMAVLRESCIDTDGDTVCDEDDNCVADPNPDQADADGDGVGDACDACPAHANTDPDEDGLCGPADPCPCDAAWKNHGEYVSCVAHHANELKSQGLITGAQHGAMVSAAGQSSCGKKTK